MRVFKSLMIPFFVATLASAGGVSASPYLEVHGTISDHAVLQRGEEIVIPGYGTDGDTVTVTLTGAGLNLQTSATIKKQEWRATFPPMKAGGPFEIGIETSSGASRQFSDIYVGEVWVASGQSNMNWSFSESKEADEWREKAGNDQLRLFHITERHSAAPVDNVPGEWRISSPDSVGSFSAVAWHFGRKLQAELDVPVGIVENAVGGTVAICWTSEPTLSKNPKFESYKSGYERREDRYSPQYMQYEAGAASRPSDPQRRRPCSLYNGMIAPLTKIPVAGIIWYQGESDSWAADDYYRLFPGEAGASLPVCAVGWFWRERRCRQQLPVHS